MNWKILTGCSTLAIGLAAAAPYLSAVAGGTRRIVIEARRFDFTPGDVTVKKGEPVTIVLTSKDVDHGLKFKDFNVVLKAKKGETNEVTFTPDKAGEYIGQCSTFCGTGHGSMKLTLHVTE